ncbi:hypothetical protein KUL152_34580 [Tenacibaculum sp. KUL152]|nr:hypothetical protein KUL152_34580 [Tenacibaculum sp. KUL152]
MKDNLESLLHFCGKKLGKIAYIGAGAGTQLLELFDLSPKELIAIEGSDELFKALNRKLKKHANVTLVNQWLFPGESTSGEVYFYNNPRFNSLAPIDKLANSNLKLKEKRQTNGISLESMVSELNALKDELNVLFLDTRADYLFLESAESVQALSAFDFIISSSDSKVKGLKRSVESCSKAFLPIPLLANAEFIVFQRQDDVIELTSKCDSLIQENALLKSHVTSSEESLADTKAELALLKDKLHNLEAEFISSKGIAEETEQSLRVQLKEFQDESAKFLTMNKQLSTENQELIAQRDNHQRHHMENKQWAESLNNENKKIKAENGELKASLENEKSNLLKLDKEYASLLREKKTVEERLSKIEKTSEMNLKLLVKSQTDLDELRSQLKKKSQRIDELILLIANLHQKLERASLFYEDLKKTNPELVLESL